MKVFLSYASEQKDLAHGLAQRLKSAGIGVFFDRDSIAPSDPFDKFIRQAIADADIFVFLASSDSLRPGAYTLTELGFAQERWPAASGRVITVLIGGLAVESLPNYLRSVSVLQPAGDIVAETVAAVSKIAERRRKLVWKRLACIGFAVLLLIFVWTLGVRKAPLYEISDVSVKKADGGFQFAATLRNLGTEPITTVGLYPEADSSDIRFPGSMEWFEVGAGKKNTSVVLSQIAGRQGASHFNWRICWVFVKSADLLVSKDVDSTEKLIHQHSQTVCSPFRPWSE